MQLTRPAIAVDPLRFGQRAPFQTGDAEPRQSSALNKDLRLFATTFVGGFLFVSLLIA